MATLAEALAANLAPRGRCQFRDWREAFSPEEQKLLDDALADPAINDQELTRRLQLVGCPVSTHRVTDHRRNRCKACH